MQNRTRQVQTSRMFTPEFARVAQATSTRILWTSITTFTAINKADEWIRPYVPKSHSDSSMIKASAALVSTFAIQPINMPFINFQTYVAAKPNKPYTHLVKSFFAEHTFKEMFRGSLGRSIHRGVYYGYAFFVSEQIKKIENANKSKLSMK